MANAWCSWATRSLNANRLTGTETALSLRYPDRNVTFRNLGWSGDTVWGEARASFGTVADGFKHLREHVESLKPTVILVGYGGNEAFAGEEQLPRFVQGLQTLLDTLAPTGAQIVLLSPMKHEERGLPLFSAKKRNHDLRVYRDAIANVARQRGHRFVDLYAFADKNTATQPAWTENGIHLTSYGYWKTAAALERELFGGKPNSPRVEINWSVQASGEGVRIEAAPPRLSFEATLATLPPPLPPKEFARPPLTITGGLDVVVRGLPKGKYRLLIDKKTAATALAAEWAAGVKLNRGPDFAQVEQMREAIVEKNRLYFYRWRPQNETYLFGFRKHEQGQNAREIPLFDPLVAQKEAEIARLRKPQSHRYVLVREPEMWP